MSLALAARLAVLAHEQLPLSAVAVLVDGVHNLHNVDAEGHGHALIDPGSEGQPVHVEGVVVRAEVERLEIFPLRLDLSEACCRHISASRPGTDPRLPVVLLPSLRHRTWLAR